jgi:hypothetical protein
MGRMTVATTRMNRPSAIVDTSGNMNDYRRAPFVASNRQAKSLRIPKRTATGYDDPPKRPEVLR